MDATGFIEKFHGISGELLKDRKKAFRLLLESYRPLESNEDTLKEIIEKLHPKTYLEETYKLEFLIYFKRVWELFDLLKNGYDIAASKIIKQTWFLSVILKDLPPEKFVSDVFPQLSLVVRLKILKQILKQFKDEEYIYTLYQTLDRVYGYRFASVLIPGCPVDKIKEFLSGRGLKISFPQLKLLHDKDRSLIRFYYEEYYKMGGSLNSLDSFSHYLSKKDPDLFIEIVTKYKIKLYHSLGRQRTKIFVKNNKKNILEDPLKYLDLKVLNKSALVRQLGKDCFQFFKSSFPESWKELEYSSHINSLLKEYPKRRRYNLFYNLFKEVYNKDLFEVKEIMSEELLETIHSHEEREKWVETFNNESKFIKYKRSAKAVPQLKEMLLRTDDVTTRKELLEQIVTTCSISKDYERLLEILKFVCKRLRNADYALFTFLDKIVEKIELEKLNGEHWKCIHELILLQDLKEMSMNSDLIFEYCKFLHKSGNTFEKMIPLFLKCDSYLARFKFVDENFRDHNFEKIFLQLVLQNYATLDEKYKSSFECVGIVKTIRRWNRNHPKEIILASQVDAIIKDVQDEMKKSWIYCDGDEMRAFKYLVCFENGITHFESIYFENIDTLANYTITKWLIKYKPEVFERNIEKIHVCFVAKGKPLTRFLRQLDYLGLVAKIEEHYVKKLTEPEQDDRDNFAQLLVSTIPRENYLKLLDKYIPKTDKLEVCDASEEDKTLLQIEMALSKSVRFSVSHHAALKILFEYCRGDCLQPALFSLYSCFLRINEEKLKPHLSLLMDKPSVSLRKHAIFLAALVFPIEINDQLRERILKEEKDISVRKHLFTSTYKYFLKNPLDQLYTILENQMASFTVHDKESLNLITEIQNVPPKFRARFAENVWKTLDNLETDDKKAMSEFHKNFFTNIRDCDIKLLSSKFCSKIIEQKFFINGHKRNPICTKFAIQFMMFGDMKIAIASVMKILDQYKSEYWKSDKSAHAKSVVYNFCNEIFDTAMTKEHLRIKLPIEFVLILREEWEKVFERQETFEEYLMLDFMFLKYKNDNDIQFSAQHISKLYENAIRDYGEHVLILFYNFMETSMSKLLGETKFSSKLMEFLKYFLEEGPPCKIKYLLVIHLLPIGIDDEKFKKKYDFVLEKIREITDPIISMSLDKRLKQCYNE